MMGRSLIKYGISSLWILDGLLQLKPAMFTKSLITQVFLPNLVDQPQWLHPILHWGIHQWAQHMVIANLGAAIIQIVIGIFIALPAPTWEKTGIGLSLVWSLIVWIWGEGLGMTLTPLANAVSGSPGSVFFYAVFAYLLWRPASDWTQGHILSRIRGILIGLWTSATIWQMRMTFDYVHQLAWSLKMNQTRLPIPLFNTGIQNIITFTSRYPHLANNLLLMAFTVFTLFWLILPYSRILINLSVLWWLFWWIVGMDFGIWGALATDPNSAPLWILLIVSSSLAARTPSAVSHVLPSPDTDVLSQHRGA
ncbi:hypothetical protein [Sulfobacillus thermosulfidooxidans]|uniref:hypothetical protein n=1 Tax=Sulfobacillus thermosulfidooxidans TaxID=28034 RepID=UPI00037A8203|nr:hypothetical protein [Sulfobacillus thermosulfidooxidans]